MSEQPAGPILDGLGVTIDLDDGDLVESALVITKIVRADGRVDLGLQESEGLDWLGQLALVTASQQHIRDTPWTHPDSEDE